VPRLLVRAGKSPLTPLTVEQSIAAGANGVFGTNAGNMMFYSSAFRALSVPGTELVPDGYACERDVTGQIASVINEQFDAYVVPMANGFRTSYIPMLDRLTRVIEKVKVPVIVIGVGAQLDVEGNLDSIKPENRESVTRFVRAVLDRSASIGVRGEYTERMLTHLGFPDDLIDVIGCPSVFEKGPLPGLTRKVERLTADSEIAINYSPYVKDVGKMVEENTAKYPRSVVIPQIHGTLEMMVWGEPQAKKYDRRLPEYVDHPLYLQDRMRFFVDASTWIDYLKTKDFCFGTRIHGNVAGVSAGTPTVLLAHDSRTRELAEYHGIPYHVRRNLKESVDAAQLYAEADFEPFAARQPETFERYRAFLRRNELPSVYEPGNENPAYDEALAKAPLPGPIHTLMRPGPEGQRQLIDRLAWLRQGQRADLAREHLAYVKPFPPATRGAATVMYRAKSHARDLVKRWLT
jgi:hypothetical protein